MSVLLRTLAAAPLALALTLLGAAPAQASVIYTYTGNPFTDFDATPGAPTSYTAANRVTVIMELAAPLGANLGGLAVTPLSFTATDGINTITNTSANATASVVVATDADGNIYVWNIGFQIFPQILPGVTVREISTNTSFDRGVVRVCGALANETTCDTEYAFAGGVGSEPGTWTVRNTTAVPEPTSLVLLGAAVAAVARRRRRRVR